MERVFKINDDASEIFTTFATILKDNKKVDCKYNGDGIGIDEICKQYELSVVLWDGAFSYASKKNPIIVYERFVTAAVYSHVELGLNVTGS
eukprot:scaffold10568_cov140-Skeletonema_dohrnii-CCMP3373.AAC.10